jgi:DNA modification methylase
MSRIETIAEGISLYPGDCLDVLAGLEPNSVDSCVTDPPYHLTSIVKRFGADDAAPAKVGKSGAYARASAGFMGKKWDGGDIAFRPELWEQVYRVLKPGAHLIAFSGTRTYHNMAVAIEQAGFEIRDQIGWMYGSGFPKSQNVAKFIDKELGVKGTLGGPRSAEHARMLEAGVARRGEKHEGWDRPWMDDPEAIAAAQSTYIPSSPEAIEFDGFGTALKPAWEPCVLARKPLIGTVAQNVLQHGTGAINIDGCRVGTTKDVPASASKTPNNIYGAGMTSMTGGTSGSGFDPNIGRWPANIIHDGSDEVVAAFPDSLARPADDAVNGKGSGSGEYIQSGVYGGGRLSAARSGYKDSETSAARFFYTAKADADDRLGSKHPTVKPVDLMQYLVRLVTPKGGVVLDPFAGTGTTGEAAFREGMRAILIEREEEYQADIRRRMSLVLGGPDERRRAGLKASGKVEAAESLPLFGGVE